jgi:hypothetical protein
VGAATAVAIFMIAREKINKPDLFDVKAPVSAVPVAPTESPSAPPPPPPAATAAPAEREAAPPAASESWRRNAPRAKAPRPMTASAPHRRYAEPPPAQLAPPAEKKADSDGLEGLSDRRDVARREADRGKAGILGEVAKEAKRERAAQPSGGGSGAGAGPAANRGRAAVARDDELDSLKAPTASRPAPAPAPAAPPAPKAAAPRPSYAPAPPAAAEPEPAPAAALATEEAATTSGPMKTTAKAKAKKTSAASPFAELVNRADRAYAGQRWGEAAGAYRELLRLYSENKSAALWRARLRSCEQALTPTAPAAAAKPVR